MEIEVHLTEHPIRRPDWADASGCGALLEFQGIVRGEENGHPIRGLRYEAYAEMAVAEMRRILKDLAGHPPCERVRVIHRTGRIPAGETAIYIGVASPHRKEGLALMDAFLDQLKQDVPIWKTGTF